MYYCNGKKLSSLFAKITNEKPCAVVHVGQQRKSERAVPALLRKVCLLHHLCCSHSFPMHKMSLPFSYFASLLHFYFSSLCTKRISYTSMRVVRVIDPRVAQCAICFRRQRVGIAKCGQYTSCTGNARSLHCEIELVMKVLSLSLASNVITRLCLFLLTEYRPARTRCTLSFHSKKAFA